MIYREYQKWHLLCDVCDEKPGEFENIWDAIAYKMANGWRSNKTGGEWLDVCPGCV